MPLSVSDLNELARKYATEATKLESQLSSLSGNALTQARNMIVQFLEGADSSVKSDIVNLAEASRTDLIDAATQLGEASKNMRYL
nr:hypothetical protein [Bifidobacterium dentium]